MSTTEEDLRDFQEYALNRICSGGTDLDLEELLDEWRNQNTDPEQQRQNLQAVKAAIREWEDGDTGRPAADVIAEIRAKHNL